MDSDEIVVGFDDTASAQAALQWAASQARLVNCTLRAVTVIDWPYAIDANGELVLDALLAVDTSAMYRDAMTERFGEVSPPSTWSLQFKGGRAGKVLVQEADSARLLVVGTGEHVGLGRVLIGSTSHYCLSHARCPVVAVPPTKAGTDVQRDKPHHDTEDAEPST